METGKGPTENTSDQVRLAKIPVKKTPRAKSNLGIGLGLGCLLPIIILALLVTVIIPNVGRCIGPG